MDFNKDILPHVLAVALFALITIIFYNPVFLENKELSQHDIEQGIGGGKELIDYREKTGKEGLWTNAMFSGMPGYLINTQWSGDLLQYIQRGLSLGLKAPARYTFWAFISFYILLLSFNVRPYLAIIGAIAFGLNSFTIIGITAGHIWRIVGMAFMPLVIAGVHLTYSGKKWLGLGLTSLGLGLQLRSNHLQMTYYLLIILVIYALFLLIKAIREKQLPGFLKHSLLLIIPLALALGSNFGKIWTVLEYSKYSIRGTSELTEQKFESGLDKEYAFQYSNGIFEPLTLVIPNIMGGASQQALDKSSNLAKALERNGLPRRQIDEQLKLVPTYWGNQPSTAPYYGGIIVFFLFCLGIFTADRYIRNWLLSIFALAIILSWGSNFETFNYLVFDYLPGYNKFRSVTFTLTIAFIAMPLLGFIGLEKFLKNNKNRNLNYLKYAIYITGSILVLAFLYSWMGSFRGAIDERLGNLPDWYLQAIRSDRARILRIDVIRNLVFVSLFVLILWRLINQKFNYIAAIVAFGILFTLDIGLVSDRYLTEEHFKRKSRKEIFTPTEADKVILGSDNIHYRVLNLQNPFTEARTSFFYSSIGGYHGAKIRRYQDLIEEYITPEINRFIENYQNGETAFQNLNVLNMLNARFFYAGGERNGVFANPFANGNAWLISNIHEVQSPDEEIKELGEIDPRNTCIIDATKFQVSQKDFSAEGTINLIEYKPDYLKYEANNSEAGFAVFSEIYYPKGWKATIDGSPTDIKRVNYVLRGLEIPPGNHSIEFKFEPASYYVGNKVSLAASVLTILFFAGTVFYSIKIKSKI